ncbi:cyanophycin synthetase [Oxalobacteraceae bacterium R-40]|uniref:Cyanophycin synthetase n=1 Tax=Keguizhuia sedimenti TaxID=3064264 RepID=A0ABU1BK46_9BURK|nr:cyanophycin synthetase [Oxalobacteraceae bacterium R-40]
MKTKKTIKVINTTFLRGPSIWTYRPSIEAWIDIGDLEDAPSNTIPGFYERLTAWLPTLVEHRCGVGERGGFLERLREGTWPAHIMEHVMIELQNLAGIPSGFGKARSTSQRGLYKLVVRVPYEEVGHASLAAARDLVMAVIEDQPFDVAQAVQGLRDIAESFGLGPSTACIVDAAYARRIPFIRLNEGNLVQIGYGARQRRIWTAETDQTSAIAEGISSDKDLTKRLLASCGVPVPEGRIVTSPEDAWEAAQEIGTPVVVKPSDGNHGRGVSLDLYQQAEIESAYRVAQQEGSEVIVEKYIRGYEHRFLVVGGRLSAAVQGKPLFVIGDGVSTVVQLIDSQINTDPRRGVAEDCPLGLVSLDEDPVVRLEITRQGLTPDSVPPKGQSVLIQRNGNHASDVTDLVHPKVAAVASLAARVVGLDIAGIDLLAEDISRPLDEQGGAIVEVNAGPGLLMHLKPAEGQARMVGRDIVDHLFAEDQNGRIPIVGIAGSRGKTMVARLTARMIGLQGTYVGLACSDGFYLKNRRVEQGDCANWDSGQRLLINRSVQAAVIENSNRAILTEGLAYDRCLVGVVTNIDPQASLPEFYIDNVDQLTNVVRTQVDVVLPEGAAVLNAADERVAGMASLCDGEVIFFSAAADLPVIAAHREQGGRVVFMRNGQIVLASGTMETAVIDITGMPWTANGQAPFAENILAAIGAAWALDVPIDLIQTGIEFFDYDGEAAVR